MAKIVLNDVTNLSSISVINANFDKIESELNNKVLYRDNPVGEVNALQSNVDANSKRIYNLPSPILDSEPARLGDLRELVLGGSIGGGGTLTPNANEIPFAPFGTISATNVQAAIEEVFAEAPGTSGGGGGGSGVPNPGGTTVANFSLTSTGPLVNAGGSYFNVADTLPNGWNLGAGRCTLDFQVTFADYFAANPGGHVAVATRYDMAGVNTYVNGQGMTLGNLSGLWPSEGVNTSINTTYLESFAGAASTPLRSHWLWKDSETGVGKDLQDNVLYRVLIDSTQTTDGTRYLRYRTFEWQDERWDIINDTGDVLDSNPLADMTKHALAFAQVFPSNLVPWSINFTNVKVTWGNVAGAGSDLTKTLSKYKAKLEGNLAFVGNGRKVLLNTDSLVDFNTWTAFQNKNVNDNTVVLAKPAGTNKGAYYFSTNSSNANSCLTFASGMRDTEAWLNTGSIGLTTKAPIVISVGGTDRTMVAKETAVEVNVDMEFPVASKAIKLSNAGAVTTWTAFQNLAANSATGVVVKPNGSGTSSTLACINSTTNTYKLASFNVNSASAYIDTYGNGTTAPPVEVRIGGALSGTFSTSGLTMNGATLTIGTTTAVLGGLYNINSTTAKNFAASAFSFDMESLCVGGNIAAFLGGAYSAGSIENVIRPLYCIVSVMLGELRDRKVF